MIVNLTKLCLYLFCLPSWLAGWLILVGSVCLICFLLSVRMYVCMLVEKFRRLDQLASPEWLLPIIALVWWQWFRRQKFSSPQCHLFLRETYFYSCGVSGKDHNNIWYSVQLMNIIFLHAKREITNTTDNPLFLRDISALWVG